MWQVCIVTFVCTVDNIVMRLITQLVNNLGMFILQPSLAGVVIMYSEQSKELVELFV